jgi:hypothetical protein
MRKASLFSMSNENTNENASDSMDATTDNESGNKQTNVDSVLANRIARACVVYIGKKKSRS